MLLDRGRKPVQTLNDMEIDLAAFASHQPRDDRVTRPQSRIQASQLRLRLDDDAAPAALIEPEGNIVRDRMPAADIDVEARLLAGESERQMIVLEVLRIGQLHRLTLRLTRGHCFSARREINPHSMQGE